jgi:hypothetical protein
MMKKIVCRYLLAAVVMVCILPGSARGESGTWMVGVKAWGAVWHSYFAEWYYGWQLGNTSTADVTLEPGYGVLGGPLVGYQSADGLWAVSGAFMFSSFSQEITYRDTGSGLTGTVSIDLDRIDVDIAVSRAIGSWFKVFAGYKNQQYAMKVNQPPLNEVDWWALTHMPTVGVGVSIPLGETLSLGLQAGIIYVITEAEMNGAEVNLNDALGYSAEGTLSWMAGERFIVQAGYRFQAFEIEGEPSPGQPMPLPFELDFFHGITLAGIYLL